MKFYMRYNNGITAIISESDVAVYCMITDVGGEPAKVGVKIFTFASEVLYERKRQFLTGTLEDLGELIKRGGHELIRLDVSWLLHVPFSNAYELGVHGEDAKERELRYVTSLKDVLVAFLSPQRSVSIA